MTHQAGRHDPATGTREAGNGRPATGLYIYALAPAHAGLDLAEVRGIGDARVHVLPHGEVTVVVSSVDLAILDEIDEDDLSESGALATLARRHDRVIQAVFARTTVLPLRFGTVVHDRAAAVRIAEDCRADAVDLFERLRGRREWGIRLVRPEEPTRGAGATEGTVPAERTAAAGADPAGGSPAEGPAFEGSGAEGSGVDEGATESAAPGVGQDARTRDRAESRSGTAYLERRRAALKERETRRDRQHQMVDQIESGLVRHAAEAVRRRTPSPPLLLDLACLVDRDRENEFLADVDEQAATVTEDGLVLETTGPWPPYTFARLEFSASGS